MDKDYAVIQLDNFLRDRNIELIKPQKDAFLIFLEKANTDKGFEQFLFRFRSGRTFLFNLMDEFFSGAREVKN